jgi:IclR family KDG regulon transcriptional repressor
MPALAPSPAPPCTPATPAATAVLSDTHAGLRSVSIAASVLDCFAAHRELGATQVARELGVAKSTACRMLSALAEGGLLDRAAGGRYRLSLRVFELGVPAAGHVAYVDRYGIDRYGSARLGRQLSGEVLRRVPGYCSSSGRVLAAFDERILRETLAVPRRKHTPFTIVDAERLARVLHTARRAGWVATREEFTLGYSSVAAPVLGPGQDSPAAAISVVGPTALLTQATED